MVYTSIARKLGSHTVCHFTSRGRKFSLLRYPASGGSLLLRTHETERVYTRVPLTAATLKKNSALQTVQARTKANICQLWKALADASDNRNDRPTLSVFYSHFSLPQCTCEGRWVL